MVVRRYPCKFMTLYDLISSGDFLHMIYIYQHKPLFIIRLYILCKAMWRIKLLENSFKSPFLFCPLYVKSDTNLRDTWKLYISKYRKPDRYKSKNNTLFRCNGYQVYLWRSNSNNCLARSPHRGSCLFGLLKKQL